MPVSVMRARGAWPGFPSLWAWEVCRLHGAKRQGLDGVTGGPLSLLSCTSADGARFTRLSPEAGGSFLTSPV